MDKDPEYIYKRELAARPETIPKDCSSEQQDVNIEKEIRRGYWVKRAEIPGHGSGLKE